MLHDVATPCATTQLASCRSHDFATCAAASCYAACYSGLHASCCLTVLHGVSCMPHAAPLQRCRWPVAALPRGWSGGVHATSAPAGPAPQWAHAQAVAIAACCGVVRALRFPRAFHAAPATFGCKRIRCVVVRTLRRPRSVEMIGAGTGPHLRRDWLAHEARIMPQNRPFLAGWRGCPSRVAVVSPVRMFLDCAVRVGMTCCVALHGAALPETVRAM